MLYKNYKIKIDKNLCKDNILRRSINDTINTAKYLEKTECIRKKKLIVNEIKRQTCKANKRSNRRRKIIKKSFNYDNWITKSVIENEQTKKKMKLMKTEKNIKT